MKRIIIFITTIPLLLLMTSCFRMGPEPVPEWDLEGPYVFTGTLNTAISKGTYTACYGDYIFFYDSAEKGIKSLNTSTDEKKLIYSVDMISHIAVNDEYVFFTDSDMFYQTDYNGELIRYISNINGISDFVVLADTLYYRKEDILYSLPVINISEDPTDVGRTFDYKSMEFKPAAMRHSDLWVCVDHIDEKNSLMIVSAQKDVKFEPRSGWRYTLIQDGFSIDGRWIKISGSDNHFFDISPRTLERSDGMQIKLPERYEYRSIYKSTKTKKFVLTGQYFDIIGYQEINPPMRYHKSDILLEIDIENKKAETLVETTEGERIISYWNGKVLLLQDDKISVFDPIAGTKTELYSFNKAKPNSNLDACVLSGYLFVYETDASMLELVLKEKLEF